MANKPNKADEAKAVDANEANWSMIQRGWWVEADLANEAADATEANGANKAYAANEASVAGKAN